MRDRPRTCVIGAGVSGLTAGKAMGDRGVDYTCFEASDDVGGNWYYGKPSSSVCSSTHLISSKRLTEFTDFPMPADYPEYPSHAQAWEYLRAYAREFHLYEHIEFDRTVERVEPAADGWTVALAGPAAAWPRAPR